MVAVALNIKYTREHCQLQLTVVWNGPRKTTGSNFLVQGQYFFPTLELNLQ